MRRLLVRSFAVLLLGHASASYAVSVVHTAFVILLMAEQDGTVRLSFTSEHPNCTNGGSPKWYYIRVGENGVTADGLRSMHATALTAFAMERQVTINFDDATTGCYINRLYMYDQ